MNNAKVIAVIILLVSSSANADFQGFKAARDFCHVEIRKGNTLDPNVSQVSYTGSMTKDQVEGGSDVNGFARRETNPGDCNAPMSNQWNSCQWGVCELR